MTGSMGRSLFPGGQLAAPTFQMDINFPDRRSIRMPGFDYRTPGGYFISLVVMDRMPLFGRIINGNVELSQAGQIVAEEWLRTPSIRKEITLDEWVIMPDHFQAIVWINGTVGAGGCPPGNDRIRQYNPIGGPSPQSLSILIAQFKATTTRRINEIRGTPGQKIWQRNYYDRIIRNEVELDKERRYIRNNPRNA